jgi:hypothetical protein|tara:strand:- start:373 stop:600 length:228 start_codon:yes stop_codon:yes gene_type:complete
MADIKVRVGSNNANKVISSISGSGGTLGGLSDVDISGGLQNGMVLVFNAATSKFEATLELTPGATQNLNINGGSF